MMAAAAQEFRPGDRVTWLYETRGNYGIIIPVAGVVLSVGAKRVKIRIAYRTYGTREWRVSERWVAPENLRPREMDVPQVDEVSERV